MKETKSCVCLHGSVHPSAVGGHSGQGRGGRLSRNNSADTLLGQAPPDADNGLVYCTPQAAQLIWPNTVIYGRSPCLILLMFILIHNAEAGLTNSGTKVLAANMSQYGQVAFSHVN